MKIAPQKRLQTRRTLIREILSAAARPMTLHEIDAAMSAGFEGESTADTRRRTGIVLAQMKQSGELSTKGPARQMKYYFREHLIPKPPQARPWRPLQIQQPYRREQRAAPGIRVSAPPTTMIGVGPTARAETSHD